MKPVEQPYEAHQICDTCQEDGECFIEEGVFENLKGGWQGRWNQMIIMPTKKCLDKNMLHKLARDNFLHNIFRFKIRPSTLSFCSLSSRSMFIWTVQLTHFFITWQLKIRRYIPVPKYNKLIVVFRSAESPVYVFQ